MAAVDIPVSKLESFAPRYQLGPLGYTFGLNENGFLIWHPNLWMDANFMEEPSHIDIEDIEGEGQEIKDLRKGMIDRPFLPQVLNIEKPMDLETR